MRGGGHLWALYVELLLVEGFVGPTCAATCRVRSRSGGCSEEERRERAKRSEEGRGRRAVVKSCELASELLSFASPPQASDTSNA